MKRRGGDRDVGRGRRVAVIAGAGAFAASVPLVLGGASPSPPREVSWPHARAGVGCASCHGGDRPPASTCTTCHDRAAHAPRGAHRSLVREGALGCTTCHAVHDGARGVAFDDTNAALLWTTGLWTTTLPDAGRSDLAGLSVPLVPVARCTGCHDPARPSDPVARCLSSPDATRALVTCFDEHGTGTSPSEAGRCRAQHDERASVAQARARGVASVDAEPSRPADRSATPVLAGGAGAALAGLVSWAARRRPRRDGAAPKIDARRRLPTIDASTCLGCRACVDACPFDVLAVRGFVAEVARPESCCGVVLCADVCPNGSLRIEEGEPLVDRPAIDARLESRDVPGVYLAGDLTGLPLIKNAIAQGALAVESIAAERGRRRRPAEGVDVLVVGAGPAGLSAGLRAQELGLAVVVIDQASLAASIKGFPRDKIVHDPPIHLPAVGPLWLEEATKEEVLRAWTRIVRTQRLDVREGQRLVDLRREGGLFVAETTAASGASSELRASRVVLAIGVRGTPRTLDLAVGDGAEGRVLHALSDAQRFAGRRVVVAGLGDVAMEAAVALAAQPGTTVTVSYRGEGFTRGKARNIAALQRLVRAGRVRMAFGTVPTALDAEAVTLRATTASGESGRVACDALFVLLGGEPAWGLLGRVGIVRPGVTSDLRAPSPVGGEAP